MANRPLFLMVRLREESRGLASLDVAAHKEPSQLWNSDNRGSGVGPNYYDSIFAFPLSDFRQKKPAGN